MLRKKIRYYDRRLILNHRHLLKLTRIALFIRVARFFKYIEIIYALGSFIHAFACSFIAANEVNNELNSRNKTQNIIHLMNTVTERDV